MDPIIIQVIIGAVALIVGVIAGRLSSSKNTKKQVEEAESLAQTILKEAELRAETLKKEKQLEAKERFVQLKAEHDKEVLDKNRKISEAENRVKQKEMGSARKSLL
jgi:ribonuclease Y